MSLQQYEAFWLSVHYFVCYHSESIQTGFKQKLAEKVNNMLVMVNSNSILNLQNKYIK